MFLVRAKSKEQYNRTEDIIELQDIRMSPIPSIRNRQSTKPDAYSEIDPSKFPPSFRISRNASYNLSHRASGLRYRGNRGKFLARQ